MLVSARDLEGGAVLTADVCIAGAGAAGITLALELRDSGLDVIVLVGGGIEATDAEQALYRGVMSGIDTWAPEMHRVRALGGSTQSWSGWCRPLEVEDFEAREHIPQSGWPITRAQLEPYYARAHRTLALGAVNYDTPAVAARAGVPPLPFEEGDARTEMFQFSTPIRMQEAYRAPLEEADDIRVYQHAHLVDVVAGGTEVLRFECRTLQGGTSFQVEAGRYVMALGGIENARMLLASDGGRGVANGSGAVGRYFMEHPHYYRSAAIVVPDALDVGFYERFEADTRVADDDEEQRVRVVGVLALSREAREREGLPAFLAQLAPADAATEQERGRTGRLGPLGVAELFSPGATPGLLNLTCRVEQTPDPDSRITLRSERDALGLPVLDLHWAIRPEDDRALLRGLELLGTEVARAGLGRLWIPTSGEAFEGTPKGGCHHMGTTRMGEDPERAVVDADCRSFDLDNLYIAGSSVFPTGGASNPTLTITALAHRLADHLKEAT